MESKDASAHVIIVPALAVQVRTVRFGVDLSFTMLVSALRGPMGGIINEHLPTLDVQRSVRSAEMLLRQHFLGRPASDNASGQKHHPIGCLSLGEVMGGNDHRTAVSVFVVDDIVDRPGRRKIETCEWFVKE